MSDTIQQLEDRAGRAADDLQHIEDQYGSDRSKWPAGQVERYDRSRTTFTRLMAEIEDARSAERTRQEAREEKQAALRSLIASGNYITEPGFSEPGIDVAPRRRSNPWAPGQGDDLLRMDSPTGLAQRAQDAVEVARGLPAHSREMLSNVITRDDSPNASAFVLAFTSDEYLSAFGKVMRGGFDRGHLLWTAAEREAYSRVEAARAAMSLTDANGGFLVPSQLDPTVVLTNSGAVSPMRLVARREVTTVDEWRGAASAGMSAEWLAEGTEAADASATFSRITIPVHKAAAYAFGSVEILADSNVLQQLPSLLADAFGRQEHAAFITGTGNGQPTGVITAVTAVTASRVTPTTGGAFTAATEVYKVWDALPTRARQGRPVWIANNSTISKIRQFDTAGSAAFWVDLGGATPANLLGVPIYETDSMASTVTTGSNILISGNAETYCIVDRLGTTIVETFVTGASNRPTYQRGYAAYRRLGGDVTDASQWRVLKL